MAPHEVVYHPSGEWEEHSEASCRRGVGGKGRLEAKVFAWGPPCNQEEGLWTLGAEFAVDDIQDLEVGEANGLQGEGHLECHLTCSIITNLQFQN